jgi:hypothetical protein
MAENASELNSAAEGRLTDHLATVLAARYAALLSGWSGEVSEGMQQQLKSLHGLCRAVVVLRRGDYHCTRLRLEEERAELAREKTQEEMLGYFEKWVENCKVQAVLLDEKAKGRRQKVKGSSGRTAKKAARASQGDVAAKPDECDGRLRQLFGQQPAAGVQGGQPAKPVLSEAPSGGAPMQSAEVVQNPSESRSVKHSQGSDGGTVALQQLDAALAENTEPEVSEAEKTRYFMEVMFGMQPVTTPPAEPLAKPGLATDAPSAGEAGLTIDTLKTEDPSPPSGVAPMQKAEDGDESTTSPPHPNLLPRGGEGTRAASGGEPVAVSEPPAGPVLPSEPVSREENDSPRPFPRPVAGANCREPVSRRCRPILPEPDGPRRSVRDGYI